MDDRLVQLDVHLPDEQAWALAQFVKRSRFDHYRQCAASDDEAYLIRDAIERLERALAEKGFKPR